jgi:hypothetical protein
VLRQKNYNNAERDSANPASEMLNASCGPVQLLKESVPCIELQSDSSRREIVSSRASTPNSNLRHFESAEIGAFRLTLGPLATKT